jgi:hypothetical protein
MRIAVEKLGVPGAPEFLGLESQRKHLERWARKSSLMKSASICETYWWTTTVGELDEEPLEQDEAIAAALVALLWALGRVDPLPACDDPGTRLVTTIAALPVLQPITDFVAGATLRPHDEIERARVLAELWATRAELLAEESKSDDPARLAALRRRFAERRDALAAGGAELPLAGDDLRALGKPYAELDEEEHAACWAIAAGRLAAFNWLCGQAADWDEISAEPP